MAFRGWIFGGIIAVVLFGQCFTGGTDLDSLEIGDCFEDPGIDIEVSRVDTLDCNTLHDFELYATIDLGPDSRVFPGQNALFEEIGDQCIDRFNSYVGHDYWDSDYDFVSFTPVESGWDAGDRTGMCAVYEFDPLTFEPVQSIGTARNSGR